MTSHDLTRREKLAILELNARIAAAMFLALVVASRLFLEVLR